MMDANGQPMGHAYAYYSSGGEEDYAATGVPYGGQVQHQYVMQNTSESNSSSITALFLTMWRLLGARGALGGLVPASPSYIEAVESTE